LDVATVRLASILSISVLLAGCEVAIDCPTDWCGTIVVTSGAEAGTLFPPNYVFDVDLSLDDLIFEKLADVGPTMNTIGDEDFIPGLADSWSFPDERTIRFTIGSNARWHDGAPVTAHDVVFTYDVYRDPIVASAATSRLRFIESVSAVDDRTVDIAFAQEYPEMFFDAVYHVRIIPRHILGDVPRESIGTHEFARSPVGSGPFRFVRWNTAEFVELAADSAYHRGRPGIPRIVWRFAAGGQQALMQLLAGEADVLNPVTSPLDQERVENAPDYRTEPYPYPVYAYIAFNFRNPDDLGSPHPLFGEQEVRRAVSELVDGEAVVRGVFGERGFQSVGPLTSMFGELYESFTPVPHLADSAIGTLTSLGWSDSNGDGVLDKDGIDFEFDLLVPSSSRARVRSAEIIQEQLRSHRIRMNIVEMEFTATFAQAKTGRFDAVFGALGHDPSPSSVTDSWTPAGFDGYNYGHYNNPNVVLLVDQAQTTPDLAEAKALWKRAFQTVIDDTPAIWVYVPEFAVALHTRLEGVSIRPDQWSATMWQWRVDPRNLLTRDVIGSN